MKSLSCKDLGDNTCPFVATDETVEGVVSKMKEHATTAHKNKMDEMQETMSIQQIDETMTEKVKDVA
jgi:predicted small metal-binding protein